MGLREPAGARRASSDMSIFARGKHDRRRVPAQTGPSRPAAFRPACSRPPSR